MNEENWISEGITRTFDIDRHLIWIIRKNINEIETPEGYKEKKTDNVYIGNTSYVRKFFSNIVPVEAELYKNNKTKEICYYFPGMPIKSAKKLTR